MERNNHINVTDRELIKKVLNGDHQAFGIIIRNTERLVTQIVCRMIPNPEDQKDKAQDIYLKAYKNLPAFQFDSKISTWIARISYNTCLDYLRKKKLVLPDNLQVMDEGGRQALPAFGHASSGQDTDEFLIRKDLSGIIKAEMEKLSPVYRTLIALFHQEELSYEEIGKITGLPEGTVKSYLFRARKAMKNNLLLQYKKEDLW